MFYSLLRCTALTVLGVMPMSMVSSISSISCRFATKCPPPLDAAATELEEEDDDEDELTPSTARLPSVYLQLYMTKND